MQVLVDCSGDDNAEKTPETAFQNKKAALLQIIEENPVAKTIIFCNKVSHLLGFFCSYLTILKITFSCWKVVPSAFSSRLRHVGKLRIYSRGLIETKGSCTSYRFTQHSHKGQGLQTWKNSPHLIPKIIHCFWSARIGTFINRFYMLLPEH